MSDFRLLYGPNAHYYEREPELRQYGRNPMSGKMPLATQATHRTLPSLADSRPLIDDDYRSSRIKAPSLNEGCSCVQKLICDDDEHNGWGY